MGPRVIVAFLTILMGTFFSGYCMNAQAHPAQRITSPVVVFCNENMNCTHLKSKLDCLTSREYDLKTALMPVRLHLARTASLTDLNSAKATELESQLAKVRHEKRIVFQDMETMKCQ